MFKWVRKGPGEKEREGMGEEWDGGRKGGGRSIQLLAVCPPWYLPKRCGGPTRRKGSWRGEGQTGTAARPLQLLPQMEHSTIAPWWGPVLPGAARNSAERSLSVGQPPPGCRALPGPARGAWGYFPEALNPSKWPWEKGVHHKGQLKRFSLHEQSSSDGVVIAHVVTALDSLQSTSSYLILTASQYGSNYCLCFNRWRNSSVRLSDLPRRK